VNIAAAFPFPAGFPLEELTDRSSMAVTCTCPAVFRYNGMVSNVTGMPLEGRICVENVVLSMLTLLERIGAAVPLAGYLTNKRRDKMRLVLTSMRAKQATISPFRCVTEWSPISPLMSLSILIHVSFFDYRQNAYIYRILL
jgi:hypothetical protein